MSGLKKWKIRIFYDGQEIDHFVEASPIEHEGFDIACDWTTMARENLYAQAEEVKEE